MIIITLTHKKVDKINFKIIIIMICEFLSFYLQKRLVEFTQKNALLAIMNYHVSSLKLKSKKPLPCIKKFPCVS